MTQPAMLLMTPEERYNSKAAEVAAGLVDIDRRKVDIGFAVGERFCEPDVGGAVSKTDADSASSCKIAKNAGQDGTAG